MYKEVTIDHSRCRQTTFEVTYHIEKSTGTIDEYGQPESLEAVEIDAIELEGVELDRFVSKEVYQKIFEQL